MAELIEQNQVVPPGPPSGDRGCTRCCCEAEEEGPRHGEETSESDWELSPYAVSLREYQQRVSGE